MSDHAARQVRVVVDAQWHKEKLEAVVAELDEARRALADYADVSGEQYDYDTLLFKYGEKARDVREYQGYARDLRARVTELEAELSDFRAAVPTTLAKEDTDD